MPELCSLFWWKAFAKVEQKIGECANTSQSFSQGASNFRKSCLNLGRDRHSHVQESMSHTVVAGQCDWHACIPESLNILLPSTG